MKQHTYQINLEWTGNSGKGTESYRSYERAHIISVDGKQSIEASSDPAFRGDKARYNPEELFLSSLASCHMLWFLHFCSSASIVVLSYTDNPLGTMSESDDGNGKFTEVTLKPRVEVKESWMIEKTDALHDKAHAFCFISNSVNFPVHHDSIAESK